MCFSAIHWARISTIVFGSRIADAQGLSFSELTIANERMKALGGSPVAIGQTRWSRIRTSLRTWSAAGVARIRASRSRHATGCSHWCQGSGAACRAAMANYCLANCLTAPRGPCLRALPLWGVRLPAVAAGVLSLSLYTGAFAAEIFRAGILAVQRGHVEAARSLGMS
jgi:hypothetical protein